MAKITIPNEKDRLIELIMNARAPLISRPQAEKEANYLIEKGCAVVVTRCQDCKHANDNNMVEGFCYCEKIYRGMPNDGFCSYGEGRKE